MSPISLILNLLLGGLLVAALGLGIRLDRKLKALRDSQAGFIKAVSELDAAAARTQAGLSQWRDATDEARELLHDRIEKAKIQVSKLDKLIADAGRLPEPAPRPEPYVRPEPRPRVDHVARADTGLREQIGRLPEMRPIMEVPALIRDALRAASLELAPEPVLDLTSRDVLNDREPPLRFRTEPRAEAPRFRAAADDDLFEAAPALRRR